MSHKDGHHVNRRSLLASAALAPVATLLPGIEPTEATTTPIADEVTIYNCIVQPEGRLAERAFSHRMASAFTNSFNSVNDGAERHAEIHPTKYRSVGAGLPITPLPEPEKTEPDRTKLFHVTDAGARQNLARTRDEAEKIRDLALQSRITKHCNPTIIEIEAVYHGNCFRRVWSFCGRRFGKPLHALQLPPAPPTTALDYALSYGYLETSKGDEQYDTRADVLDAVADWNTALMRGETDDDDWALAVEVGEPIDVLQFDTPEVYFDGLGLQTQHVYRPIRLVRPTAAEIADYAD